MKAEREPWFETLETASLVWYISSGLQKIRRGIDVRGVHMHRDENTGA